MDKFLFPRVNFRRPSENEIGAEWVVLRKKDREILSHAGQCKRAAVALVLLSFCLCVCLVLILREFLVPVKCQFFYIKWVQMMQSLPCARQLRSSSFHKLFRAFSRLAPFGTSELDLYWYQDAN
jgi:hypothetical protein